MLCVRVVVPSLELFCVLEVRNSRYWELLSLLLSCFIHCRPLLEQGVLMFWGKTRPPVAFYTKSLSTRTPRGHQVSKDAAGAPELRAAGLSSSHP